jgi:hypothetical protein
VPATTIEMGRLKRVIDEAVRGITADLSSKAKPSQAERQSLRADIDSCIQKLDELRSQLNS